MSKKFIYAINLKVEPYPNPYKMGWIKERRDTQISEICSVPSSIEGSYKDRIVCDVLDMDACDILLERPCQYDIQATYKGRENTNEFQWMNKKIILLPPSKKNEKDINSKLSNNHLFISVSGKQFVEKGTNIISLIIVQAIPPQNASSMCLKNIQ